MFILTDATSLNIVVGLVYCHGGFLGTPYLIPANDVLGVLYFFSETHLSPEKLASLLPSSVTHSMFLYHVIPIVSARSKYI